MVSRAGYETMYPGSSWAAVAVDTAEIISTIGLLWSLDMLEGGSSSASNILHATPQALSNIPPAHQTGGAPQSCAPRKDLAPQDSPGCH